jgi:hypothetical protein
VFDQIADAEDLDKIASSGQGDQNLMQEIIEEEEICAEQAQLDEQRTGNANDEEDTIAEMGSALVQRNAQDQESSKNKSKTAI